VPWDFPVLIPPIRGSALAVTVAAIFDTPMRIEQAGAVRSVSVTSGVNVTVGTLQANVLKNGARLWPITTGPAIGSGSSSSGDTQLPNGPVNCVPGDVLTLAVDTMCGAPVSIDLGWAVNYS
jgi:hypothetical protein